ncbi:hypothetical protein VB620_05320 [Nodularia harveyana UHCC-0300]|uniref:G5 domain-containing protein n=1 Tax=Nodularia harveyana UHCC-0300 TaxID=2974287 RepID=A0ABU5UCP2_9CYAN|nr:hypothetical protein [Nodularia harveyana]MEA5580761.1 hypothetical protein [Nodularia harveyana UHCC-0300]
MQSKPLILQKIIPLSLIVLLLPLASCQIEKEQAGSLPEVNVEPGKLPQYDIQGPDVKVGVAKRTVTVPKVIVIQEEQTVEVPYIDVDVPGADRKERTITTEVEVPSSGYNLEIQGIYALNNELWVVSQLQEENPNAPKTRVRVSDRVVVNSPDIPVRQYIIGERPESSFNEQYTFINSRQPITSELESGQMLYQKPEETASK